MSPLRQICHKYLWKLCIFVEISSLNRYLQILIKHIFSIFAEIFVKVLVEILVRIFAEIIARRIFFAQTSAKIITKKWRFKYLRRCKYLQRCNY